MILRSNETSTMVAVVIEHRRKKEGKCGDDPYQFLLIGCFNAACDKVKTIMRIDDLHDRHGAHQEKQYSRYFAEVPGEVFGNGMRIAGKQGHRSTSRAAVTYQAKRPY